MANALNYNFSQQQCVRSLKRIGFVNESKRSKHLKFHPPDEIKDKILSNKPQFIMIPHHRELKIQKLIIKELHAMGGKNLVKLFIENL